MRLDKFLSNANVGTRKEVGQKIKSGRVTVNELQIKSPKVHVKPADDIKVDNDTIVLEEFIYFMLNKPAGVISSTEEGPRQTVVDLIDHPQVSELFPVGRLDKDTTGLLLITNDGKLAHGLTSPRKDQKKTYRVRLQESVNDSDIRRLTEGIPLKDFTTKPAQAEVLGPMEIELTITEGKFHQVKRMFRYLGNEVIALKRIRFADLELDDTLNPGESRRLNGEELSNLLKMV